MPARLLLLCTIALPWTHPATAAPPSPVTPAKDILGDPLPVGALTRIGSARLRHADPVDTLACSADGRWLASYCRWENSVAVWETSTGKLHCRLPVSGVAKMSFSTDGNTLALMLATSAFTAEILVECWDVAGARKLSRFRAEERYAENGVLEFSQDGKYLLFGRSNLRLLDWTTGKLVYQVPMGVGAETEVVSAVALTADGTTLITAEGDAGVHLRDAHTGQERCRIEGVAVSRLALAPDGKTLALGSAAGFIELWQVPDVASQKPGVVIAKRRLPHAETSGLLGLTFSRDGQSLLSLSAQGSACLWDVAAGQRSVRRQLPESRLGAVAIDQAQRPLAVTGDNRSGGVALWNVAAGKELFGERNIGAAPTCLAFSPDGKMLVTGSAKELRFWKAGSGQWLARVDLPDSPCQIDFRADGKNLVAGGAGQWWNVSVGKRSGGDANNPLVAKLLGAPAAASPWKQAKAHGGRSLPWKLDQVDECTLTPDGFLLDLKRNQVQLLEGATGNKLCAVSGGKFYAAALAPNRRTLVAAQNETAMALTDVPSSQEILRWDLPRQELIVGQPWLSPRLAFAPGGRLLAIGTPHSSILMWDLAVGQQVHKLTGHDVPIALLAFAPDGRTLACAYRDTSVLIWDVAAVTPTTLAGINLSVEDNWLD